AGALVDLYTVVRQGLRAGVERYSIKNLEPLYGFAREVELADARRQRDAVELAIELGSTGEIEPDARAAVEGYNRDDCLSALRLRDWLEGLRAAQLAKGVAIPRPEVRSGEPSDDVDERARRVEELRRRLLAVPDDEARYLMAYLLDWHRRE